ncbi:Phage-related minor tail protein [Actinobacillus lignieresii]|nr:Phage-related minor tail protein [Actinobacillus lignieresii]
MSGPLKGVMKQIDTLGAKGKKAISDIGMGAAGLFGAGMAMKSALEPAIEFNNMMANVAAAGVETSGLQKVKEFALEFSSEYGIAAANVVDSTNEIARAIDGLTDNELISFSKGSNILAKATGSDVAEMGSYLSTMYGIFQQEADKMGKSKWVEMMAGQATLTANMFKSSGKSLSDAFTNLMATGQAKGVAMAEQFAVLGNLQSVMPGGQSGTKYAAFLKGVGSAQYGKKALGLDFMDENKRMRPIVEILRQIRGAYGDTIDEVEARKLRDAFGTDEAVSVITYLLPKIDQLKDNISEIGDIKNLDDAAKIAKMVTSPWERLAQVINNVKIAIGTAVLKKLEPIIHKIADWGAGIAEFFNKYQNIARWAGYIALAVIGFGALAASITVLSGVIGLVKVGALALLVPFKLIGSVLLASVSAPLAMLAKLATALSSILLHPLIALKALGNGVLAIFAPLKNVFLSIAGLFKGFYGALLKGVSILRLAFAAGPIAVFQTVFSAALTAVKVGFLALFSPMSLFVAALIGIGVFIYKYRNNFDDFFAGVKKGFGTFSEHLSPLYRAFDMLKAAFSRVMETIGRITGNLGGATDAAETFRSVGETVGALLGVAFEAVIGVVELIAIGISGLVDVFAGVTTAILSHWDALVTAWTNNDWLGLLGEGFKLLADIAISVWEGIKNTFLGVVNWIISKWNAVSNTLGLGIEIPLIVNDSQLKNLDVGKSSFMSTTNMMLKAANVATVPASNTQLPASVQPNGGTVKTGTAASYVSTNKQNVTYTNTYHFNGITSENVVKQVSAAVMQQQHDNNQLK